MKWFFIICIISCTKLLQAQGIANGDFSSGTASWGCSPETNAESVYGGSSGTNAVAEVDNGAGLCQTISGFTIGSVYRFSISYCRRTGGGCPAPNPAGANITIGSVLTASVSSNLTTFSFQTSSFNFTANQTSLTLNVVPNFTGSTCGLIVDNLSIVLYSGLPIELLYFKATLNKKEVLLDWKTATQTDNDFFTVERSADGLTWQTIQQIKGAGTLLEPKNYATTDYHPLKGESYYRLKQTDYDKKFSYSPIVSVSQADGTFVVYPNPVNDKLYIITEEDVSPLVSFITIDGKEIDVMITKEDSKLWIDVSSLDNGIYTLRLETLKQVFYKKIMIAVDN